MSHLCRRMAGWNICWTCGLPMGPAERVGRIDLDGQRDQETVDRDLDDDPESIAYTVLNRRERRRP